LFEVRTDAQQFILADALKKKMSGTMSVG